jgi:hypothetical protein
LVKDQSKHGKVYTNFRDVFYESDTNVLHLFTDASKVAYGAWAYLVKGNESAFLMAKNRVASLKQLTIPQLELMAL